MSALEKPFKTIKLRRENKIPNIKGKVPNHSDYDFLLSENIRVLKPDGSLLLHLCKQAISEENFNLALPFIDRTNEPIKNRSIAAGAGRAEGINLKKCVEAGYKTRTHQLPDDLARSLGSSAIVGYYDRYTRMPFARVTRFTFENPELWGGFVKMSQQVAQYFKYVVSDRYKIQQAIADAIHPAWVIPGTPFTTVTVNRNFKTSYHLDAGDLKEGFGCMTFFQIGDIKGGYLVMSEYRVAVKLEHRDLLFFDVHEWHGNTDIIKSTSNQDRKNQRITCIFYLREDFLRCGTPEFEAERAKRVRQIKTLYDPEEIARAKELKESVLSNFKNK